MKPQLSSDNAGLTHAQWVHLFWVNLGLYSALLVFACAVRPAPLSRSFEFASHRRRKKAHALILLFAATRVAWAIYTLSTDVVHGGIRKPCSVVEDYRECDHAEFVLDCASALACAVAAGVVLAQVASTFLSGFRSALRLWVLVKLLFIGGLAYSVALVWIAASWGDGL